MKLAKRVLSSVIAAAMSVGLACSATIAPAYNVRAVLIEENTYGDFTYFWYDNDNNLEYSSNDHIYISECSTDVESVEIPSEIGGVPVLGILPYAFRDCTKLTSVTISEGVEIIDGFYNCTSLETIILPSTTTKILSSAFDSCTSLKNITIPEGVEYIGAMAFSNCSSLESIVIPESVTDMDGGIFYNCTSLKEIRFLNTFERLEYYSPDSTDDSTSYTGFFGNCTSLESVTLPEGVKTIEDYAFYNCTSLTEVVIPDTVTKIDAGAFFCCQALTEIKLPPSLESIETGTFMSCTSLKDVVIPETVDAVHGGAFAYCSALETIVIPKSVQMIGDWAFEGCDNLKNIVILNPDCEIVETNDEYLTIPKAPIIYGYEDSTAQQYAEDFNREFISISATTTPVSTVPHTTTTTTTTQTTVTLPTTSTTTSVTLPSTITTTSYICIMTTTTPTTTTTSVPTTTVGIQVGITLTLGQIQDLRNGYPDDLVWMSSNNDVVYVENGIISGAGVGEAVVYAFGGNAYYRIDVTVKPLDHLIGDISNNGVIDLYDAIEIAKALIGKREFTLEEMYIADYNCDGMVDLYDVIHIAIEIMK